MYMTTRLLFHEELTNLDENLMRMGTLTRSNVRLAFDAFNSGSVAGADKVLNDDDIIDDLEVDIEMTSMRLLALQQPMARDLRRISSAIKVSNELERIGDHAVLIAKSTRKLAQQCFCTRPLIDIEVMATATIRMIDDCLTAFLQHDMDIVARVCGDDDHVDEAYKALREEVLYVAQQDPSLIAAASYTLLILTSVERIADHATNIAERVAYMETGEMRRLAREHRLNVTHFN
jgi:phosphate transport system protein